MQMHTGQCPDQEPTNADLMVKFEELEDRITGVNTRLGAIEDYVKWGQRVLAGFVGALATGFLAQIGRMLAEHFLH